MSIYAPPTTPVKAAMHVAVTRFKEMWLNCEWSKARWTDCSLSPKAKDSYRLSVCIVGRDAVIGEGLIDDLADDRFFFIARGIRC